MISDVYVSCLNLQCKSVGRDAMEIEECASFS